MRASQLLLPTVKEDPAGAEAISHKLMVRAGLVRQLAAGVYVYLPAGWRVMQKIAAIIREEMDAIGCQEMLMPVINPAEIWQQSGRWDAIDEELFRLKDRKGADMALAMTHEEVITWLAAREVHSYKQLPQLWYHIQTKERDEARPKSGVLRTREFIMKDSYSLDVSFEALQESYRKHIGAYERIYARCGLAVMMVEGDSGMMGGDVSHEYMAFAEAGEDEIVYCRECGYAANVETAVAGADAEAPAEVPGEGELHTPGARTIAEVSAFLGVPARGFVKALVVIAEDAEGGEGRAVMVLLRGDHELSELKLRKALGAELRMATADEVLAAQGIEPGFVGPVPTSLPVIADEALRRGSYVAGANKPDYHRGGVSPAQIPQAEFRDLRQARPGDPCARCAHAARGRPGDRGRQHLPARHQVLAPHGRHLPRRGRQGAGHRHGQLRHRPGAHRRRRHRAAPRRQRHRLAGGDRAVPRAPRARARLRRDAGGARRAALRRARRRRLRGALRRPRPEPRASSSRTPTCSAARRRWSSANARPRASSSSRTAPAASAATCPWPSSPPLCGSCSTADPRAASRRGNAAFEAGGELLALSAVTTHAALPLKYPGAAGDIS